MSGKSEVPAYQVLTGDRQVTGKRQQPYGLLWPMQSRDVQKLIENEIGDDWTTTNHHHVDLRRALVQPRRITVSERTVSNGKMRDETLIVWLVLVERHDPEEGYRIVMKKDEPVFGLASEGFPEDDHLVLCGWYGDFMTAFRSM